MYDLVNNVEADDDYKPYCYFCTAPKELRRGMPEAMSIGKDIGRLEDTAGINGAETSEMIYTRLSSYSDIPLSVCYYVLHRFA